MRFSFFVNETTDGENSMNNFQRLWKLLRESEKKIIACDISHILFDHYVRSRGHQSSHAKTFPQFYTRSLRIKIIFINFLFHFGALNLLHTQDDNLSAQSLSCGVYIERKNYFSSRLSLSLSFSLSLCVPLHACGKFKSRTHMKNDRSLIFLSNYHAMAII